MSVLQEFFALPKEEIELSVTTSKTCRRSSDLTADEMSQLSFVVSSPSCGFGNPKDIKTVEDCFNKRNVDDGLVFYKEMKSRDDQELDIAFHYWLGYFGGNSTGYLLLRKDESTLEASGGEQWDVLIHNCDTDFIWCGKGDIPKHFIRAVKKAAYGDKYFEEDEED